MSYTALLTHANVKVGMCTFNLFVFPHLWFSDSISSFCFKKKSLTNVHGNGDKVCVFPSHPLCKPACSQEMLHFREETGMRESDCLSPSVISQDMSFLMDFLIFVCEVIWYVSTRLWLAPHGAANWWSGCSCVNITLIHPFVFLLLLLLSVSCKPWCHIFIPETLLFHHWTWTAWYLRHAHL